MRLLHLPLTRRRPLAVLLTVLVGIALPFLVVSLVPYYHTEDLAAFSSWAACLDDFGDAVYLQCGPDRAVSALNYPSAGLMLSGGIMRAIARQSGGSGGTTVTVFRYFVASFAALAFLLLAGLAREMRFAGWSAMALLILIVPSTLVGGVLWGQLDGASLVFCLVAFLGFWRAWRSAGRGERRALVGWLAVGACGLIVLLLLKPLNTFTLPFFVFLASLIAVSAWRVLRLPGVGLVALVAVTAVAVFRYFDTRFAVPPGFWDSTYWYSWSGAASPHAGVISGNGFNLWVLLGRDIWSSSRVPFAEVNLAGRTLLLAPFHTGIILFGLFLLFTLAAAIYGFWPQLRSPTTIMRTRPASANAHSQALPDGWQLALLCLFFALTQIGFNVLLTGTHERYLYLGYPFLLIATFWLASRQLVIRWRGAAACWAIAFLNGVFVYGAMRPLPGWLFPVWNNAFQATLHLGLLVFVFDVWWRALRRAHATVSV